MTDVSIAPATRDDIPAVVDAVAGLFAEDSGRFDHSVDQGWPAREGPDNYLGLVTDDNALLAVARDGDQVVGYLVGKLIAPSTFRPIRHAVLESMRVAPDRRGAGVGSRLMTYFLDWTRAHGAARVTVSAYTGNEGAQRFYARHGFRAGSVTLVR